MKAGRRFIRHWFLGILMMVAWTQTALATPPSTPITLDLTLSHVPRLSEQAVLTVTVQSIFDAPGTSVELVLPAGAVAQAQSWTVDLMANVPVTFTSWIIFQEPGNLSVGARALKPVDSGAVWGDMKEIPLNIGPVAAARQMGWKAENVPVAVLAERGDTDPISMEPTPFSFSAAVAESPAPEILPGVEPAQTLIGPPSIPLAPGTVTLTGRWQYTDRSNVARDIDQQRIEIRKGDGSPLNPRVFNCSTAIDGTFSCSFPHPGTTMRVWVRSWQNFNRPGGTDRLGVFSGIEVTNGCGSDSFDCTYPVQTGVITCADGATCNVGTWTVNTGTGEPWLGAHQMTQDLIRSWKKIFFDPKHGTGVTSGPGRITYPVPTGHGTHAHVTDNMNRAVADGWISIEPPNQRSGDPVNHEYGHVVMANKWSGFNPNFFPTNDCPSPHFIQRVSGLGCALSEGWANLWAWYSNEFYDGTNDPANYGPVYNFGGGGSTNMKTRDNGTYDAGDRVEGNIAANMGDMFDSFKGIPFGPTNVIFADNLADGIQHVWHVTSSRRENNFSEWWNHYWNTFGHDRCRAYGILLLNTINYGQQCPDLIVTGIATNPVSPVAGQPVNVTVTVRNQGNGAAGSFFVDWYSNRASPPPLHTIGQIFCTTPGLAAGATSTCNGTFTYATAGVFNMWAQVDTEDQVSETNEVNNVRGPQPITVQQPFNYSLTNSGNITVIRGSSGMNTITAMLTSGATQPVSLGVTSGLPAGATATFSPNASCSPTCSRMLTIDTTGATPTGTFLITVSGMPLGRMTTFNLVVNEPFDYSLTNSEDITVIQGSSGSNTITATRVSGATQAVSFDASGLPAGATPMFSPASCNPTCSSTLTIDTTGVTPTGTFPITVTGMPLGRTTMFNLVVNEPPFDYLLSNSGNITVTQGSSGSNMITATLVSGATQAVSFDASGLPPGATPIFSPGSCNPDCSSTLTIATTGVTPTGTVPITVTGMPLGQTTTFNLTVNPQQFTLTVTKLGSGSGTVTSNPAGIDCGATCSATYNSGTMVDLTASADAGSVFAGWTDAGCFGTGSCTVTINADTSVIAYFNLPSSPPVSFDPATYFGVGTGPVSVAVGDFNGDGFLDLVVANAGSNNVSILLGDGTSGFGLATDFPVGTQPSSVVVGDFNGDGFLDLVVANAGSNDISILLGDGTGSFGSATDFPVGTQPSSVMVGDFNGDANLDLAVANLGSDSVSILLGDGTGGFGSATDFPVGTQPGSVMVGDFNGDANLDLAVANFGSNNVSILLGDGTGSFGPATDFPVGTNPSSVVTGDLNGDGFLDLAVANTANHNVSIVLGDGTGSFGAAITNFPVGITPQGIAIGDLNGDLKLDLAVPNSGSNNVSVLLNTTP